MRPQNVVLSLSIALIASGILGAIFTNDEQVHIKLFWYILAILGGYTFVIAIHVSAKRA